MKYTGLSIIVTLLLLFSFSCKDKQDKISGNNTYVLIETELGNMKFVLYDNTPKHKENFIKLVKEGFYNDLLFHRVIKDFMIQGGDPDSKSAGKEQMLGNGGPGYTIAAEINSENFHKKGVLSAARLSDQVNPEKASSGSQFYIVQGKIYNDSELDALEKHFNRKKRQTYYNEYFAQNPATLTELEKLQVRDKQKEIDSILAIIDKKYDFKEYKIPAKIREIYKQTGGTPFLDNEYTVFGEIVEGMEVIDKIANLKTDTNNRPEKNIKMRIKIIEK